LTVHVELCHRVPPVAMQRAFSAAALPVKRPTVPVDLDKWDASAI
jgi:hypothetical protein